MSYLQVLAQATLKLSPSDLEYAYNVIEMARGRCGEFFISIDFQDDLHLNRPMH